MINKDQTELATSIDQVNKTEDDNPRTWKASSTIHFLISKDDYGKSLRCVAIHESYSTRSSSIEVLLDVLCKFSAICQFKLHPRMQDRGNEVFAKQTKPAIFVRYVYA